MLGTPQRAGEENGAQFDEFRFHGKLANTSPLYFGPGYAMGLCLTCGLLELYCFPEVTLRSAWYFLRGHDIRVYYDDYERVTGGTLNGDHFNWRSSSLQFVEGEDGVKGVVGMDFKRRSEPANNQINPR